MNKSKTKTVSPIWSSAGETGGQHLLAQVAVLGEGFGKGSGAVNCNPS